MDNSKNMRVSVPPGTSLQGKKSKYTVINIICLSDRSVTVLCNDEKGAKYRLKLYNGDSSVTDETQKAICSIGMNGVVLPYDVGQYSGFLFSVFQNLNVTSTDQFPISVQLLKDVIIPQISYVMNQYHRNRILLRDICPEHILYDTAKQQIAYCGYGNAALLQGKATVTKEPGYGQHHSFLAPEVENYGYSIASDYFSLGVTLLSLVKGKNPLENMSRADFLSALKSGKVPGIDIEHLKRTPYDLYSAEDKILYLVLGLMLPDPGKRWQYGEIRCWCNNQHLPLVQSGERIRYQFNEPFAVNGVKCWNEKQLAKTLAEQKSAWNNTTAQNLLAFLQKQNHRCVPQLAGCVKDNSISGNGKIFRCIYLLDPAINGLWWEGRRYSDTGEIVRFIKSNALSISFLSLLLKDGCLSFYAKARQGIGAKVPIAIAELEQMEQMERSKPGQGANRCMMVMANSTQERYFVVGNEKYNSVAKLIEQYKNNGGKLRELSAAIVQDATFQAWLWAKGMERIASEAARRVKNNPDQSFLVLMSLCESCAENEDVKKSVRGMYLRYGEVAPIVWLANNVKYYQVAAPSHQTLHDTFRNARFNLNESLEILNRKAHDMVSDYQVFVGRTQDNPFLLENEKIENLNCAYYPVYESGFFCCKWINGLEVCPAFLKSVGSSINRDEVNEWLKKKEADERNRLDDLAAQNVTSDAAAWDSRKYLTECDKNFTASIIMLIAAVALLIASFGMTAGLGVIPFVVAILFPGYALNWYYQKKVRAEAWFRTNSQIDSQGSSIKAIRANLSARSSSICSGIMNGKTTKCNLQNRTIVAIDNNLPQLQSMELGDGSKWLAYISLFGYVLLAASVSGAVFAAFPAVCLYALIYGVGGTFFILHKAFIDSCNEWKWATIIVAGAALAGGFIGAGQFFVVMNWAPFVIAAVIFALSFFR